MLSPLDLPRRALAAVFAVVAAVIGLVAAPAAAVPATTPDRVSAAALAGLGGYWVAGSDGGIFTFGGVPFVGSAGALHLNQPMAGIAKKEEILYVLGQEDEPIILERHSPVLHLIQQIRDETHRFAVSFHRQRRGARQTKTALLDIPGIGPVTAQRLLQRFGSVANLQRASKEELSRMVSKKSAEKIRQYFAEQSASQLTVINDNGG